MIEKESDLAAPVIDHMESLGWEVFQEVQPFRGGYYNGRVVDLVGRRGSLIWVVELKRTLSLAVMEQAHYWRENANYVSVATPGGMKVNRLNRFKERTLRKYGIGLMLVEVREQGVLSVYEKINSILIRKTQKFEWNLCEEHKTMCQAGSSSGGHFTAFKATVMNLKEYLKRHPGATLKESADLISHHYASPTSAAGCFCSGIKKGFIKGIRMDTSKRPFRLYLKEEV